MNRSTLRIILPTVLLLPFVILAAGLPEATYASCTPGRTATTGNWHDGYLESISIPTSGGYGTQDAAVKADIYQYDSYVYPTSQTSVWTMLQDYQSTSCCWAQIGYDKYKDSGGTTTRITFTQWTHNGTYSENQFPGDAITGQTDNYETFFNKGNPADWYFYEDGTLLDAEGPEFVPTSAFISYGEISNVASQMPGGSSTSYHEPLSNAQYMQPLNTWNGFSGTAKNDNSTDFGENFNSTTHTANIWDKACST